MKKIDKVWFMSDLDHDWAEEGESSPFSNFEVVSTITEIHNNGEEYWIVINCGDLRGNNYFYPYHMVKCVRFVEV